MDFRHGIEQIVADREHGSGWLVARISWLLESVQERPQSVSFCAGGVPLAAHVHLMTEPPDCDGAVIEWGG